jgi:hypothetical protein
MTTETLEAEDEMTGPRRFSMVEDMVIFHHPEWLYLINATLPVREPTEEETAAYKARLDAPEWAELYQPQEPRIVLPPHAPELTTLLSVVRDPEPDSEPGAVEGVIVPDDPQAAQIQRSSLDSLARWAPNADTGSLSAIRDEPEVHHETQVLHVVPEDES